MQLIANVSWLFAELPLEGRFEAADRAGFDGVEIQFPYESDPDSLRRAAGDVPIVLINVPVPDGRGGIGGAVDAASRDRFAAGLETAFRYADVLGIRKVNVLPGAPPLGQSDSVTSRVFSDNVLLAADRMEEIGVEVVVEALNPFDSPGAWLDGLDKALRFLAGQGDPRVRLQLDLYHMARTEPDLAGAIAKAADMIGHVQFADHPGRHEPGSGGIDFAAAFAALRRAGYRDTISAEYRPAGPTRDGLGWMEAVRRWAGQGTAGGSP